MWFFVGYLVFVFIYEQIKISEKKTPMIQFTCSNTNSSAIYPKPAMLRNIVAGLVRVSFWWQTFSNEKKFWLYVRELLPAMGYLYERAISDDLSMSQCRSQSIYDMHPTVLFWGQITNISAHDRHLIIPSALWFRRVLAAHNAYCCDAASVIVPTPMQNSKHTSNSPNRWQIEQKNTIS